MNQLTSNKDKSEWANHFFELLLALHGLVDGVLVLILDATHLARHATHALWSSKIKSHIIHLIHTKCIQVLILLVLVLV